MGYVKYAKAGWGSVVKYLARDAEAVSSGNGITDPFARNAITHAHGSAVWTADYGREVASVLGELKELPSSDPEDTVKDQYNNEVGRRIPEHIEDNNLSISDIDVLVIDAFNNGQLIIDEETDPRVINQTAPTWPGPSANWQGSSLGRDYSGTGYGAPYGSDSEVGDATNPAYRDYERTLEEAHIVGRVVARWQRI